MVFGCSWYSHGQSSAEEELGAWYILSVNTKLKDQLTFNVQGQYRYFELADALQQFKIRTGLTYRLSSKVAVSAGYGYFETDPSYNLDDGRSFVEQRLFEDVHFYDQLGKLKVYHRYRAEHRFFNRPSGNETDHWMRYMLRLSYPVAKKWTLDVYDEVFINLQKPFFGQNWLGGGITHAIYSGVHVRLGYFKFIRSQDQFDRMMLSLVIRTDFRK